MSKEFLRRLPVFSGLTEEDLDKLYEMAETVSVEAGHVLMEEGTMGDSLYVVLDGIFEVSKRSGQQEVVIASCKPGEVIGEISLIEQIPRSATVRALTPSRLLKISQASFEQLLSWSSSAALNVLRTVIHRLRNTESMLRQNEKMAALGTLAAGLAHELNNPAAAVRRSVAQLRESLAEWQRLNAELDSIALELGQKEAMKALREEMRMHTAAPAALDPLARSDREGDLQAWLEDHGVDEAWELAPALLNVGWDVESLRAFGEIFPSAQFPVLVKWLGAGGSTYTLLDEAAVGAERISEIVKAVKTYSYLDQAPIQEVDVHEGLENTLIILRHKLGQRVNVTREYAPDMPRIEAYATELNQVWTNIIDNALDAMEGEGELTIRTYPQDGQVVVEIKDDGPGIPPEIQSRIFDPFFTTKPPGIGTGLGLHIAYSIIAQKHQGQIKVTSQPGATCFQVVLPVQLQGG
jgi:signal transduction histidine kinase